MPDPTPAARKARRVASAKRRRTVLIIAATVAIACAVGVVVATSGSGTDDAVANSAPATIPAPTATTTPAPTTAATSPPAEVATTKVPSLQVFDAPDSTRVITSLSDKTDYLLPRTLLVTEQRGSWLKALLPMRPNESVGWIRLSDVTVAENPYRITVSLADHLVTLYKDGQEILRTPAVVGADRTPTPLGTFYITDPVDLRSQPGGAYGAYALGLSGYSEVLFEFNGGPGQIAIHGTNNPELVGRNVSNGCVRVPNDMIVEIARQAPLGTPVVIT